jgi:hypothetical protein
MTRHDIICMVLDSIFAHPNDNPFDFQIRTIKQLQCFASLVADAEREACAKVCEEVAEAVTYQRNSQAAADKCAEAIRARELT